MENKQKIEFKSLDDFFELFTTRIRNRPFLRNIVQECMPDCKEMAYIFLLLSSFANLLHMASHNPWVI
jgi:hypothetical protein